MDTASVSRSLLGVSRQLRFVWLVPEQSSANKSRSYPSNGTRVRLPNVSKRDSNQRRFSEVARRFAPIGHLCGRAFWIRDRSTVACRTISSLGVEQKRIGLYARHLALPRLIGGDFTGSRATLVFGNAATFVRRSAQCAPVVQSIYDCELCGQELSDVILCVHCAGDIYLTCHAVSAKASSL